MPPRRLAPFGAAPDDLSVNAQPDAAGTTGTPYTSFPASPGGGFGIPPTAQSMGPGDLAGTPYSTPSRLSGSMALAPESQLSEPAPIFGGGQAQFNTSGWGGAGREIVGAPGDSTGPAAGGTPTPAPAPTEPAPTPTAGGTAGPGAPPSSYAPVEGAEIGKLNNPSEQSPKYRMLRALQTFGATRGNMQAAVDYYNKNYGGNARVVSDDTIDMGIPGWDNVDLWKAGTNAMQWVMVPRAGAAGGGTAGAPAAPQSTAASGAGSTPYASAPASPAGTSASGIGGLLGQILSALTGGRPYGTQQPPTSGTLGTPWDSTGAVTPESEKPYGNQPVAGKPYGNQRAVDPAQIGGAGQLPEWWNPATGQPYGSGEGPSSSWGEIGGAGQLPEWWNPATGQPYGPGEGPAASSGGTGSGGANLPPGYTPEGNTAQDPMSALINSALAGILGGGSTPFGGQVQNALSSLIGYGGVTPETQQQILNARERSGLMQRSMLEDARGALADAGTLSEPGIAQGPTSGAVERIGERIAPEFASSLRDIYSHAIDVSNASLLSALQMATGLSQSQANNILQAIGTGTNRQTALSSIALQVLAQNMDWQKFLAQHNLDQARLTEDIQNGRMDRVIALLQLFLQAGGTAGQGYI